MNLNQIRGNIALTEMNITYRRRLWNVNLSACKEDIPVGTMLLKNNMVDLPHVNITLGAVVHSTCHQLSSKLRSINDKIDYITSYHIEWQRWHNIFDRGVDTMTFVHSDHLISNSLDYIQCHHHHHHLHQQRCCCWPSLIDSVRLIGGGLVWEEHAYLSTTFSKPP